MKILTFLMFVSACDESFNVAFGYIIKVHKSCWRMSREISGVYASAPSRIYKGKCMRHLAVPPNRAKIKVGLAVHINTKSERHPMDPMLLQLDYPIKVKTTFCSYFDH